MANVKRQMSNVKPKVDIRVEDGSVTFWLRVKPRSSRERLTVDSSGEPRLELHAAPTEGRANDACIAFLAHLLKVPRSSVGIVIGEKSRRKLVRIQGGEDILTRLRSALG